MNSPPKITGLIAAPHTPFHPDGSLNLAAVEKQVESLVRTGAAGAFVAGTTGEFSSLQIQERLALTQRWLEVARKTSLKVLVHVGSNCQQDSVALARQAARLGADGIASVAPSYFKAANVSGLVDFLAPIAAAAEIPFYFYDIPAFTHVHFRLTELLELAGERMPTFRGVKYSNLDMVQLQELVRFDEGRYEVLFGFDECLLGAMAMGVVGAVGATYNFAAPLYLKMMAAFAEGDWETARREQFASVRLVRILAHIGFQPAAKRIVDRLIAPVGPVRSPVKILTAEEDARLAAELERSGLWARLEGFHVR